MRAARLPARAALALALALAFALACPPCAQAKKTAPKPAPKAEAAQPGGEPVDINGRVAAGLDKTFIKDQVLGYLMVQGADLSRFAGRHIQAKGLVVGREDEYRVVRLLEYRVKSPDDDSPGAGGTISQGEAGKTSARKKK